MKKVLIIGHFWPYRGGSGRVIGLVKYLPEFGWEPIVLTAPLDEKPDPQFRIIETSRDCVLGFWKKLFGFKPGEDIGHRVRRSYRTISESPVYPFLSWGYARIMEIVYYPDRHRSWKRLAIKSGTELLENEDIDTIISIWPVTSHLIAKELKGTYQIPWVSDFPDLWSQNHNYSYGRLRHFFDQRLELKTLLAADALVTVSEPWAEKLRILHKRKSVYAVTHGFDPEEVNSPPAKLTDKFTITYTGTIYRGKQDPSRLFAALRDLISNGAVNPEDIEVRFYGLDLDWLANEIEGYGLSAVARYYGTVPREIAFEKQRESQLLLLLNWDDYQEKGWHSLKIYAYLGARRPIITVGGSGDDVIKELLDETKAGVYCRTVEDLKNILSKSYLEYKHKGEVSYKGEIEQINKYNYREMARKFADILDSACKEK